MNKYEIYKKKFTKKTDENSGWLIVVGLLMLILGIGLISYTFIANIIAMYFVGIFICICGILQIISASKIYEGSKQFFWSIIGLVYLIIGILTILYPLAASFILTTFIAVAFIFVGLIKVVVSIQLRPFDGWQWGFFSSVISILIGVLIIATPGSFTWVIGLFIALDIIFQGSIYLTLGFGIKTLKKDNE